jgi:hypothetical protein
MKNKEKNEEPKPQEPGTPEPLMERHVLGEIASGYLFGTVTAVLLSFWGMAMAGLATL